MTKTTKRDYYEVLGVSKTADAAAIKKAYRKLAKKYHPDTNAGDPVAEEKLKEVNEAYDVLGMKKRRNYMILTVLLLSRRDLMRRQPDSIRSSLRTEADSAPMDSAALATARSITAPEEAVSVPVILAASAGMRIFLTICSVSISKGQKGSGRGSRANYRSKGQDVESGITISFDEAMHGCDKTFTLRDPATGKSESVQVHIPAGIDTGKSIRLKGKGW